MTKIKYIYNVYVFWKKENSHLTCDLPDPRLVKFKHSLFKNKTEQEVGGIIIQQIFTYNVLEV